MNTFTKTTALATLFAAMPLFAVAQDAGTETRPGAEAGATGEAASGNIDAQIEAVRDLDEVERVTIIELTGAGAGAPGGMEPPAEGQTGAEMDRDATGGMMAGAEADDDPGLTEEDDVAAELGLRDEEDATTAGDTATDGTAAGVGADTGATGTAGTDMPAGATGETAATGDYETDGTLGAGARGELHTAIEENESLAQRIAEHDVAIEDVVAIDVDEEDAVLVYVQRN